ncbi:MAG: hypothetical protein EOO00_14755, partial [Chitinophagaceae bacterium]
GKVAGLSVVNNGTPGASPDIRIRGTISIGSVRPLFVVDGIFQDNIDYLNPNDIESLEVLKDPSSLAIFGVKGAPGVIAITTKKAKSGQVIVNFNTSYGVKQMVDKIKMASGDQFREILAEEGRNQAFDNAANTGINDFIANGLQNYTGNTDWVDALTRTARQNTNNISVNASTEKNRFNMGLGYTSDEGLVKHVRYQRLTIALADEFKVSKNIKIGFTANGSREKAPYDGNSALAEARKIVPIVDDGTKPFYVRNPYGGITDSSFENIYSSLPNLQNSLANPLLILEKNWDTRRNITSRIVGSIYADITFLRDFNFRATLYADNSWGDNRKYNPLYYAYDPGA